MKCPYCGVNELGTGDINGKCCACENKFNNSGYPLLGEVRAVITEMLLPHISSDSEDVAITKMYALRNSYIDTYNNTIRDVLKKLSEHFS